MELWNRVSITVQLKHTEAKFVLHRNTHTHTKCKHHRWLVLLCKLLYIYNLLRPTVPASTGALGGPGGEAVLTIDMVYVFPFPRPVRVCVSVEPSLTVSLPLSLSLV